MVNLSAHYRRLCAGQTGSDRGPNRLCAGKL